MKSAVEGGWEFEQFDQAQDIIEWEALLSRQVSLHWKRIKYQYYIYLGKLNTGERWVRLLTHNIWDVAWDQ
jgi:hypothetical protein